MAIEAWPFAGTTVGMATSAPYTDKWFRDFFQLFLVYDRTTEVIVDTGDTRYAGGLQVNDTGGDVTVQTGVGIVNGNMFRNTTTIPLTPDDTPTIRTDRVIVRVNYTTSPPQTVEILLKKGTDGNNTPPALTQDDANRWEVALAEVDITPGPTIAAVRNTGRIVRTPLGPGFQFDSLETLDIGPRTDNAWQSLDPPVAVTLGPGQWMIEATTVGKAQNVNGFRRARIYNVTLAEEVRWAGQYAVSVEDFTVAIPRGPVKLPDGIGVICVLELQVYGDGDDNYYGDDNAEGPSTSIVAERVV